MYNKEIMERQNRITYDLTNIIGGLVKSKRNPYPRKQSKSTLVIDIEPKSDSTQLQESLINEFTKYLD